MQLYAYSYSAQTAHARTYEYMLQLSSAVYVEVPDMSKSGSGNLSKSSKILNTDTLRVRAVPGGRLARTDHPSHRFLR